jgi:hypothetical protein
MAREASEVGGRNPPGVAARASRVNHPLFGEDFVYLAGGSGDLQVDGA